MQGQAKRRQRSAWLGTSAGLLVTRNPVGVKNQRRLARLDIRLSDMKRLGVSTSVHGVRGAASRIHSVLACTYGTIRIGCMSVSIARSE